MASASFVGAEPGHRPRYYVQESLQSTPRAISGETIVFDRGADDIVISPDGRHLAATRNPYCFGMPPGHIRRQPVAA